MAFSPSKRVLATASSDRTIGVWSVVTGTLMRTLARPKECSIGLVRVSDDGAVLVKCNDGTLRELDGRSGMEARVAKAHGAAFAVVVDRAGTRALTVSVSMDETGTNGRQRILLWDLDRLAIVRVAAEVSGHVAKLAWSDDGRLALVSTYRHEEGTLLVDLDTGKTLRRFESKGENAVERLEFDASGRRAIIVHAGGPTLVFDVVTGKSEQRIERALPPFTVGFDDRLLSVERGLVQSDVRRLEMRTEIGWRGPVSASAFSSDRTQVALAGSDALRVVDTSSGSVVRRFDFESIGDWQAAIAPDGLTVAIKRCRVADRQEPGRGSSVGSRIDVVSLETGATVKTLRAPADEECGPGLTFLGTRLIDGVGGSRENSGFRVWDVVAGSALFARTTEPFYRLTPFPDDRTVLMSTGWNVARLDLDTLSEVARYGPLPEHPICRAVSPNGELVMIELHSDVRVWDAKSAELVSTFPVVRSEEEAKGISANAAFSPDATRLAIAEATSIRIHDPRSGALVRRWSVEKRTAELEFIDGGRLVSTDWDGVVTIWDVQTGRMLATDTRAGGPIVDLRAVDGVLITASRDTAVRLLPVP